MSTDQTLPPLPGSTSAFSLTGSIYTAEDMRDYARAALAQQADEPTLLLDGQTPLQFALGELHAFQEATGCDTASDIATAAPAYVPLSDLDIFEAATEVLGYGALDRESVSIATDLARAIESLVVARMRGEG